MLRDLKADQFLLAPRPPIRFKSGSDCYRADFASARKPEKLAVKKAPITSTYGRRRGSGVVISPAGDIAIPLRQVFPPP